MPFKSEKQRRFMWAKHPEIAKKWANEEKDNPGHKKKKKKLGLTLGLDSPMRDRRSVEKQIIDRFGLKDVSPDRLERIKYIIKNKMKSVGVK